VTNWIDGSHDTVSKFSPGSTTPTATLTGINNPQALACDGSGDLFVVNWNNTVSEFAPGSTTPTATLTGLHFPSALAFDSSGNLYVSNSNGGTVSEFAPGSTTPTATLSGMDHSGILKFDANGNLYVTDWYDDVVYKFAPGSITPTATLTGVYGPTDLAVDAGSNLYVLNWDDTVSRFAPGSTMPTATLTGLSNSQALACDGSGNLYVTNWNNDTVSKFSPGSTTPTAALNGLNGPSALAFDAGGNLFVVNGGDNTVSNFAAAGGVVIGSSLPTRPMSLGGTSSAVAGINLTDAELAQIRTTSSGTVTIGDSSQTGNITMTTATIATTAGASTVVVQAPGGPGRIILDDAAGAGTAFNGNDGRVTLSAGTGGIQALSAPNAVAEVGNATSLTLNSSGGMGTNQPLQLVAADLTTDSSINNSDQFFSALSTLTATSLNAGDGTIHLLGGTVLLGSAGAIHASSAVTVASGATLDLNGYNATIGSLSGSGAVALNHGDLTAGGNNGSTTFSGVITGTGGLTKSGSGSLTLSGTNSYTGDTVVSSGILFAMALNNTGSTTVAGGASLQANYIHQHILSVGAGGKLVLGGVASGSAPLDTTTENGDGARSSTVSNDEVAAGEVAAEAASVVATAPISAPVAANQTPLSTVVSTGTTVVPETAVATSPADAPSAKLNPAEDEDLPVVSISMDLVAGEPVAVSDNWAPSVVSNQAESAVLTTDQVVGSFIPAPVLADHTSASTATATSTVVEPSPTTLSVTQADVHPTVSDAIARWAAAGLNTASLQAMKQVQFVVADLPGSYLGLAQGQQISLDLNSAGHGWFVDPTPAKDEEFAAAAVSGQEQATDPRAVDHIDLLTMVEHELGYTVGLDDLDLAAYDLMSRQLATGIRQTASTADVDMIFAHPQSHDWL
jgi:autotransporter-associated beta strand protein